MRDLVEKAKGGDLEAFGVLVDRYKDAAYGASYAVLGNFHDAQDVAQEAFIRAWKKLATLKDTGSFPAWLCRIARNISVDHVRRTHQPTKPIDEVSNTLADAASKDPGQCAEQNELHQTVLQAIRALSEPNRLATALFYINGYSVEEVADFLDVPAGTVKRRLHDSRNQLRERMVAMIEDTFKQNPLADDFSLQTLEKIGDFTCLSIIGAGPLGRVYLCEHPVRKRKVAIKILTDKQPEAHGYVRTGYDTLNKLNHPGIVKAFSYGEHEGHPYVVMECLHGQSLQGWLNADSPPALWRILRLMVHLTDAVCHAHDRGVVVGAISHQGIVCLNNDVPVLVELGWKAESMQSDIRNLGLLLYQLLLGAFWSEDDAAKSQTDATLLATVSALSDDRAADYVVSVLDGCLQADPRDGFSTAFALLNALVEAQFANLVRFESYDILRLLHDVEADTLVTALTGADTAFTTYILNNVTTEIADKIRVEMEGNSRSPKLIHAARRAIVNTANRLLDEQRIRLF